MAATVPADVHEGGHVAGERETASPPARAAPVTKRAVRALFRTLPRTALTYDLGKLLTRTILRPERHTWPVDATFAGRVPMTLDLGALTANDLYCLDDHYEATTLRLWRALARDARGILDVGSHMGAFALLAAAENRHARILAVEADEALARQLGIHARPFRNVAVACAAVAPRAEAVWFCPTPGNEGGGLVARERPPGVPGHRVQARTLSDVCRQAGLNVVDLVKLDVEGLEHALLTEDEEFLRAFEPRHLLVEIRRPRQRTWRSDDIFATLARRGYRAQRVQGLYALPWLKDHDLANWHFTRISGG